MADFNPLGTNYACHFHDAGPVKYVATRRTSGVYTNRAFKRFASKVILIIKAFSSERPLEFLEV